MFGKSVLRPVRSKPHAVVKYVYFLSAMLFSNAYLSQPAVEWQKTLGGSGDEQFNSIKQTADLGYILSGTTVSMDGDVSFNFGGGDYWLAKVNESGNLIWEKTLGGSADDYASAVCQTLDGGYIVAGITNSNDGIVSISYGNGDFWIVKLDAAGNLQWEKTFGGSQLDNLSSIELTTDGGYIVSGYTSSNDGDVSLNNGGWDIWVIKLDPSGNMVWEKSLGGSLGEIASSIVQTSDGGYIVAGTTSSIDGDVTGNHGAADAWIVKLDNLGNIEWQNAFGGTFEDGCSSIKQTSDGGYILTGNSFSNDGNVTGNHGGQDIWVLKLYANGNISWQKSLGGNGQDVGASVAETNDGGFVIMGYSDSNGGDRSDSLGLTDYWIIKLDNVGNLIWEKSVGGSHIDIAYSMQLRTDGGIVGTGWTFSNDGLVCGNNGNNDAWIVNLNACSNISPAPVTEVCAVGLDSLTNKNMVIWEKPLITGIDSFYVYREVATSVFTKIGALDNCGPAIYIDFNSVPMDSSYRYKIATLNVCGDTSDLSINAHRTVQLTVTENSTGIWDLSWNSYEGFNTAKYYIYRGTDPSNIALLDSVNGSILSYTDATASPGAQFYQIEAVNPDGCDPTKINGYGVSRSNIANNGIAGLFDEGDLSFSIYPNPTNGGFTLESGAGILGKSYQLLDGIGREVSTGIVTGHKTVITTTLQGGTYYLSVDENPTVLKLIVH
jgi:hypothetical protein